ncbi:hypothetical protein OIU77_026868 [Salix suchowensis]|uniref:Uncharacterized protein n=1 Tax=Salix suchowensis TaxID=1278906 RepID=A0ABQ9BPP6_9ROSI|nr:hypothetical protein OIU77_026868 [Salix suchowensis]
MWGMIPETLSPPDGGLNTWLFMEPSPSASAELVSNQFPKTTDANLNTQVSGATSTGAPKKRLLDKAYRERCKELKMNTEIKMDELAKENDRLRRENDSLKKEQGQLVQTLQHQKDEMTQPEKEFGKLQDQLNSRNMVAELLLKQSKNKITESKLSPEMAKVSPHVMIGCSESNSTAVFATLFERLVAIS